MWVQNQLFMSGFCQPYPNVDLGCFILTYQGQSIKALIHEKKKSLYSKALLITCQQWHNSPHQRFAKYCVVYHIIIFDYELSDCEISRMTTVHVGETLRNSSWTKSKSVWMVRIFVKNLKKRTKFYFNFRKPRKNSQQTFSLQTQKTYQTRNEIVRPVRHVPSIAITVSS